MLLECWDPIGIRDEPNAQDEYDSYINGVLNLLLHGASEKEISDHLWRIIEERINIHPQRGATERTVRELKGIPVPKD